MEMTGMMCLILNKIYLEFEIYIIAIVLNIV